MFKIFDFVRRSGSDIHMVIGFNEAGDLMDVLCVKAESPWCRIGDIEDNLPRRYTPLEFPTVNHFLMREGIWSPIGAFVPRLTLVEGVVSCAHCRSTLYTQYCKRMPSCTCDDALRDRRSEPSGASDYPIQDRPGSRGNGLTHYSRCV